MKDFSVPQKPLTRSEILEDAQAMQRRFAEQTREQIKVSNRLSAQRDAMEKLCEELIDEMMERGLINDPSAFNDRLEAAKNLDPEAR